MLTINKNNREENEKELISLLLHKQELIDLLQIKPKYLFNKQLGELLEIVIKSYKKNKIINPSIIIQENSKFNCELFADIYTNTFYYENAWKEQFNLSQESIIKYYKQDINDNLYSQLKTNKISYEEYNKKISDLSKITLSSIKKETILNIKDINFRESENLEYVKSGNVKLDYMIGGFALGQLSVWSGGNASAKSTYLNQIAIESVNQGYKTLIYSGELIAPRLLKWIIMQCAGKRKMSYNRTKDYYYVPDNYKNDIVEWLDNKLFIYNNECGNKVKQIVMSIKECVSKNNIKVVIIDNLMSMNLSEYSDNKFDTQSLFVQELSALSKELNIHIHFVCHPRKTTTFLRKNDISGSADLTNIADNVFIMHRVNNDFRIKTKEMFKWNDTNEIYDFSNVVEVCKNREKGIEDYFSGMYFEKESKRLLNSPEEDKNYGWYKENVQMRIGG